MICPPPHLPDLITYHPPLAQTCSVLASLLSSPNKPDKLTPEGFWIVLFSLHGLIFTQIFTRLFCLHLSYFCFKFPFLIAESNPRYRIKPSLLPSILEPPHHILTFFFSWWHSPPSNILYNFLISYLYCLSTSATTEAALIQESLLILFMDVC